MSAEVSPNKIRNSITAVKISHEKLYNFEIMIKFMKNFTIRIDELTNYNTELKIELK
jgi:hypothetical protein